MTSDRWVVALDSGGTTLKSAAVPLVGEPSVEPVTVPIDSRGPAGPIVATLAAAITGRLGGIPSGGSEVGIAVALPGPFDYTAGIRPPGAHPTDTKYLSLAGVPLAEELAGAAGTALPMRFVNDAAAAALGEARFGAGRGAGRVLMVTLGTGLGAALVSDGGVLAETGGVLVGELFARRLPDGTSADDAFSHRGLLTRTEALGEPEAAARSLATDLGAFLSPIVAAAGVDIVVVGGGVAGEVAPHLEDAATVCGAPMVPSPLANAAALLGAATLFL